MRLERAIESATARRRHAPRRRNLPNGAASVHAEHQALYFGRLAVDQQRLGFVLVDRVLVEDDLGDVVERRQLEHGVDQRLLHDRAQAARAGLARQRLRAIARQRRRADLELDAFHREQLLVLLDQRVLRLGEDLHQRVLGQLAERRDHRQAADQFGDQAELDQVFGLDLAEDVGDAALASCSCTVGAEADARASRCGSG